jgi:hypothetical protein
MLIKRYGGLPSSGEKAAYNRAERRQPTEYTENAELQRTEIDAAGIKRRRKRGITEDRVRCQRHQKIPTSGNDREILEG